MALTVVTPATQTKLTTLDRVKAELGLTDTAADLTLGEMIAQASATIAAYLHRVCGRETVTETLPGTGRRTMGLSRTPLVSITSVYEDSTLLAAVSASDPAADSAGYYIEDAACGALGRDIGWPASTAAGWDRGAIDSGYILGRFRRWRYAVTYVAGWKLPEDVAPTLPGGIERACLEMVKRLWIARAGVDPNIASEQVGDIRVAYRDVTGGTASTAGGSLALPPTAVGLLAPWRVELGGV